MARVEIPYVVEKTVTISGSAASQPVSGASVQVNVRGGSAALVYAAETGGSPISNPLTTDANGLINGWVEEGSYNLVVSGSGITTATVPIDLVRGDTAVTISTAKIADGAVTTLKLATGAVVTAKIADGSVGAAKLGPDVPLPPTGVILPYGGSTAPTGYLLCDGTSYTTASQAALFSVLGYTYGGSGSNFNVPDMRGRVPVGSDNMGTGAANRLPNSNRARGQSGGAETHSHTVASHAHGLNNHTHNYFVVTGVGNSNALIGTGGGSLVSVALADHAHNSGGNTGGPSNNNSENTSPGTTNNVGLPPYAVAHYIIKA